MLGCQFSLSLTDFILGTHITVLEIEIKTIWSNLHFTHLKQKIAVLTLSWWHQNLALPPTRSQQPRLTLVTVSTHANGERPWAFCHTGFPPHEATLRFVLPKPHTRQTLPKLTYFCLWFSIIGVFLIPLRQSPFCDLHLCLPEDTLWMVCL